MSLTTRELRIAFHLFCCNVQSTAIEYTLRRDCTVYVTEVKNVLKGSAQTKLHADAQIAAFDTESVLAVTFLALVTAVNEHAVVYPPGKCAFSYGSAEIWPLTEHDPVEEWVSASSNPALVSVFCSTRVPLLRFVHSTLCANAAAPPTPLHPVCKFLRVHLQIRP